MQKEDIRLRQVIIHIMDSTMGMPVLSDQVIDFGSDFGDFLRAHIFRSLLSICIIQLIANLSSFSLSEHIPLDNL